MRTTDELPIAQAPATPPTLEATVAAALFDAAPATATATPEHTPARVRATAAAGGATADGVLHQEIFSVTVKPCKHRDTPNSVSDAVLEKARAAGCKHAKNAKVLENVFGQWRLDREILKALAFYELGKQRAGSHLQAGLVKLTTLTDEKAIEREISVLFHRDLVPHLLTECIVDGQQIKMAWHVRMITKHETEAYLVGYCAKQMSMHHSWHVALGYDEGFIKQCHASYIARATADLNNTGAEQAALPGQHAMLNVITRDSLLSNAAWVERHNDYEALGLTVCKLTAIDVASGRSCLHAHFAGTRFDKHDVSELRQNILMQLSKNRALANNYNIMHAMLYGAEADENSALERILYEHLPVPPPRLTNQLTADECNLAISTGTLPTRLGGGAVQSHLQSFSGEAIVIDLAGDSSSMPLLRALHHELTLRVVGHVHPYGSIAHSPYVAALAARLVLSSPRPFDLTDATILSRLHPAPIAAANRLLALAPEAVAHALTHDHMLAMLEATVSPADEYHHAWLKQPILGPSDHEQPTALNVAEVLPALREALYAIPEGAPALHMRFVRTPAGGFITIAWRMSLLRASQLRRAEESRQSAIRRRTAATAARDAGVAQQFAAEDARIATNAPWAPPRG